MPETEREILDQIRIKAFKRLSDLLDSENEEVRLNAVLLAVTIKARSRPNRTNQKQKAKPGSSYQPTSLIKFNNKR